MALGQGIKTEDFAFDARGVVPYGLIEGTSNITRIIVDSDGRILTSERPHTSVVSGRKAVASATTAVKLIGTATPCKEVMLSADTGNTDVVVVGSSGVVAAQGSQEGLVLFAGNPPVTIKIDDLSKLWVDAISSGDAVLFTYLL